MKKAPVLITFAVIAVALGITFLSQRNKKEQIDYWQLIPASSVTVLETPKPSSLRKLGVDTNGLIEIIAALGRSKNFTEPYLFCFQSTGKQLAWAALTPRGFSSPLDTLELLKKTLNKRNYEGKVLYDYRDGNTPWATLANIEGIWIFSPSSLVVEEIVRQSTKQGSSFRQNNKQLFTLPTVKQDDGNLYMNLSRASAFAGKSAGSERMGRVSHSMILDLKWNDLNLQGNGFAADTAAFSTVLSMFTNQKPVPFDLRKRIPDQFSSAVHFGFSDPALWFTSRDKVFSSRSTDSTTLSTSIEKSYGFSTDEFAKAVDDEIMYCGFGDEGEVIVIELKEITRAQTQMDKIRRVVANERENYADRAIVTLKKDDALASLIWPFTLTSPETSYSFDGNLLLISGREESIKEFIDFNERDQTLGKSISWSKFLETTLGESNVDFVFNSSADALSGSSLGLPAIAAIDKASLQFYALKGNYYSSTSIQFAGRATATAKVARPDLLSVKGAGNIIRSPWIVRNHQERENEVMVQDEGFHLRFLSKDGKVRWSKDLAAAITTSIEEIDYLKNGKVQYLFCTPGQLHLVDRLGKDVKGFPKKIDVKTPQWLSVVDYDKSRNYRIAVADTDGNIFVFDKNAKALEGWDPKSLQRDFTDAPSHYRIRQKDYYVAVTTNGTLHMFSRRGDKVKGFPVDLKFVPSGDIFCDGKLISAVSESGMLTKINADGKPEVEEPILTNITAAKFRLTASQDRREFVVTRTERGNLAVFDASGAMKFEIVNPLSDRIEVHYYRFDGGKGVIVIQDVEQKLAYVLDMSGKMLTGRPTPATHSPVVDYDAGKARLTLVVADQKQLGFLNIAF